MQAGEFYYWGPLLYRNRISQEFVYELLQRGNASNIDFRPNLAGILEKESQYTIQDKEWFAKEITPTMIDYGNTYLQWYGADSLDNKLFQLENLWINYMHPGDFNPMHVHTGDLSFVLYLQVPDSLKAEYDNWREISKKGLGPGAIHFLYGQCSEQFLNTREFFPEVGDMYIFPAGLYHTVAPFKSDGVRISVSGNYKIVENE